MSGKFEKAGKQKFPLPGWLFVVFMAVYCELVLHLWTTKNIMAGRLVVVILFALGLGSVLGFVSSLFSKAKVNKGVAIGVGVFLAVFYMTE